MNMPAKKDRSTQLNRKEFDRIYDNEILNAGFFEKNDYYLYSKDRYWESLRSFARLNLKTPSKILEIGGGQLAVLCKEFFNDEVTVADVSEDFRGPLDQLGIDFLVFNLLDDPPESLSESFDAIILLEIIEHLPVPPYIIFERLKRCLKPGGTLFLTTPNLFRLRNLIRMFRGKDFTARFVLPEPGVALGHQLEYSAEHMQWQIERAGMINTAIEYHHLGRRGFSRRARLARKILAPLRIRKIWRDGLIVSANKPCS